MSDDEPIRLPPPPHAERCSTCDHPIRRLKAAGHKINVDWYPSLAGTVIRHGTDRATYVNDNTPSHTTRHTIHRCNTEDTIRLEHTDQ